jgi:hypothetical protein
MALAGVLYQGMGQPYRIRNTVLASNDLDPSQPTGAVFVVTKPDKTSITWVAALSAQSSESVQVIYNLVGDELDQTGFWDAWIQFTVPGETPGPRCDPFQFWVKAANQP